MKIKTEFPLRSLNSRDTKCLHRTKHLLGNFSGSPRQFTGTINPKRKSQQSQRKNKVNSQKQKEKSNVVPINATEENQPKENKSKSGGEIWGTTRSGKCWRGERNNLLPEILFEDHG